MHINVSDILIESVGYSRTYKISGERPELESVNLTQDIEGEISLARLDNSILLRGHLSAEIQLQCHRCLSTFRRPSRFNISQEFSENPDDDQMPIIDNSIDIAELVSQEIILSTPIKVLCRIDCPGITEMGTRYTKVDTNALLGDRARITKGTKRGRT